ncbi:hypothetical protein Q5P01_010750 [Channa striata]|uniref:Uncharacterized protein n=1 Tax=Channa striata TaxID=64152 RepID=A0AA88SNH3_CHASR|nr:hypothetical protein Q5P01_010750 [Channa striata]
MGLVYLAGANPWLPLFVGFDEGDIVPTTNTTTRFRSAWICSGLSHTATAVKTSQLLEGGQAEQEGELWGDYSYWATGIRSLQLKLCIAGHGAAPLEVPFGSVNDDLRPYYHSGFKSVVAFIALLCFKPFSNSLSMLRLPQQDNPAVSHKMAASVIYNNLWELDEKQSTGGSGGRGELPSQ